MKDPNNQVIKDLKIQSLRINMDIKLHRLNEAQDSKIMTESKRILREMKF